MTTAACVTAGEGRIEIDGPVLRSEPDAIVLGVVTRAIVGVAGALTRPVRLERFEARILGDLRAALDRGGALRMTLGGALIDVCPGGRLALTPEPPRRRERRPGMLTLMPQGRRIHLARMAGAPLNSC